VCACVCVCAYALITTYTSRGARVAGWPVEGVWGGNFSTVPV